MIRLFRSCVGPFSLSCQSCARPPTCGAGCSASRSIGRRITTRPTRSRRWRNHVQPTQSATFFYSAIFAAAVVADAEIKVARRKQWDDAIRAAEQEASMDFLSDDTEGGSTILPSPSPASGVIDGPPDKPRVVFERICRRLALYWRDREGRDHPPLEERPINRSLATVDINTLISEEEWPQFEEWAVQQIRAHNQSLPEVQLGAFADTASNGSTAHYDLDAENLFSHQPEKPKDDSEVEPLEEEEGRPWGRIHYRARYHEFTSNQEADTRLRLWMRRDRLIDFQLMRQNEHTQFVLDQMLPPPEIVKKWPSGAFDGVCAPSIHDVYQARPQMDLPVIGKLRSEHRFPPQSIEANQARKEEWMFRPKSAIKLLKLRLATAKLVSRLGRASGCFHDFSDRIRELPQDDPLRTYLCPDVPSSISQTRYIENVFIYASLESNPPPDPAKMKVFVPTFTTIDASSLNAIIYRDLCRLSHGQADRTTTLVNICRALLTSTSPPDVTTFGLLLSAFSEPSDHRLFTAVYWEMIRARIRPNEHSCAIIFYHFAARCDPVRFIRFHAKVFGASSGLMLANPTLRPSRLVSGRFAAHHTAPHRLIQKVTPHPLTFQYILYGLLRFLPDAAVLEYVKEQLKRGWSLSMDALGLLIRVAAANLDWEAGQVAWGLVQAANGLEPGNETMDETQHQERLGKVLVSGIIPRDVYVAMLVLCRVCNQDAMFDGLLATIVREGWEQEAVIQQVDWFHGQIQKQVERRKVEIEAEAEARWRQALELEDHWDEEQHLKENGMGERGMYVPLVPVDVKS